MGSTDIEVNDLQFDSRKIKANDMFFAINGTQSDGHSFIDKCVEMGATVVVCEVLPNTILPNITYIQTDNSAKALAICAANYFNNPSENLTLVGVTGTNGKTTTATLLFQLFRKLGYTVGLISTVQNQINDEIIPSTHTTPDPLALNKLLFKMLESGCKYVFMEVSSHAVHQHRIAGLHFAGAIFTNITHDHLDYHKTFDAYIAAKKMFFDGLTDDAFALTNADDKRGSVMLQNTKAKKYSYSLRSMSNFNARILENRIDGLVLNIDGIETHCSMIGEFNAYNILAVYASAVLLGVDKEAVLTILSTLNGAAGRFQIVNSKNGGPVAIVDYAHTPDAIKNVLQTIKGVKSDIAKIITVVGCGGDRDKSKRPIMAQMATDMSDKVILTSDNPRTENPNTILEEMYEGVSITKRKHTLIIADRHEAIKTACALALPEDIVLIAGKGHENYQEINGVKHPFDDVLIVKEILNN